MPARARAHAGTTALARHLIAEEANGPANCCGGPLGDGLDDAQANVDIAAGRVGVGTYLVCLLHQGFRLGAGNAG
jgi:hypothetical protein